MPAPGLNRRALLQWGALLTAGAVLPGCGGGGGPRDDTLISIVPRSAR